MTVPSRSAPASSKPSRAAAVGIALLIVGLLAGVGIGYLIAPAPGPAPATNTISISGSTVHLSVLSGPGSRLVFLVGGLTNPTIGVDRGANITVHFLNIGTLPHSWALLTQGPPYDAEPPTEVAFPGAETPDSMMGTPSGGNATISFTASTAGTYWYLCHVPGHASGEMYGKFVVQA